MMTDTPGHDSQTENKDFDALQRVLAALRPLERESRSRVLQSVIAFFNLNTPFVASGQFSPPAQGSHTTIVPGDSEDLRVSPKQFLTEKQPKTDIERIACLAYYLTHFRDTPFFKTKDLSSLNTEAAQQKFSNAAYAGGNALKAGLLAQAAKGRRQLSAAGEQFVTALPDRAAARETISSTRRRKRSQRSGRAPSSADIVNHEPGD